MEKESTKEAALMKHRGGGISLGRRCAVPPLRQKGAFGGKRENVGADVTDCIFLRWLQQYLLFHMPFFSLIFDIPLIER